MASWPVKTLLLIVHSGRVSPSGLVEEYYPENKVWVMQSIEEEFRELEEEGFITNVGLEDKVFTPTLKGWLYAYKLLVKPQAKSLQHTMFCTAWKSSRPARPRKICAWLLRSRRMAKRPSIRVNVLHAPQGRRKPRNSTRKTWVTSTGTSQRRPRNTFWKTHTQTQKVVSKQTSYSKYSQTSHSYHTI